MAKLLPKICKLGLYDASSVHKNKSQTPPRRVSLYEIEYIIEDGGASHIDGNAYSICKNSVIVAKPGQTRYTELPFKSLFVHFLCEDNEICSVLDKAPDFFSPANAIQYHDTLQSLIEASTGNLAQSTMEMYEILFRLLALVAQNTAIHTEASENGKGNIEVIKKALEFIDTHFCENITLDDAAKSVHLSRIYFRSIFVAAIGATPYEYIKGKRLSKAKQMILTSEKSYSEIALECGFSSQSYMNSVFKKEFGLTPKQFKEQNGLIY